MTRKAQPSSASPDQGASSRWRLQDAKARFSELVRRAHSDGPQHVTLHGRDAVVVVDADEFHRLAGGRSLKLLIAHKGRPMFEQRVLEVLEEVMPKWRLLVEDGRKAGHTFSQPDLIIAATAVHHGLTVVTRDTGDYALARVPLLNPWVGEAP